MKEIPQPKFTVPARWEQKSPWHYRTFVARPTTRGIINNRLDYWPSKNKIMYKGVVKSPISLEKIEARIAELECTSEINPFIPGDKV